MRNLLVLSEPFGGGHTKAAEATAALFPSWNCRVVELASYLDPILAKHISKGYLKTVQMAPWLGEKSIQATLQKQHLFLISIARNMPPN